METTTRLILPEVIDVLRTDPSQLLELTEEMHPADLADLAAALEPELAHTMLTLLPVELSAKLLAACEGETRLQLFANLAVSDLDDAVTITDAMAPDDRADLYSELPEQLRGQLLDAIDAEESRDIRQLLSYPEGSAGALLTTDFVALPATATAESAINLVRKNAAEMETIYQAYAVDPHGTLLGAVSLRDLVTSPANRQIDQLLNPNIVTASLEADQEEVARLIAKYDLLAIPVVDRAHHIVGIITVDDVLDVVQEEATEDAHKMAAIEPIDTPYLATPLWQIVRKRAPWLMGLCAFMMVSEYVLERYTSTPLGNVLMLLWFVPVIVASGGNSGAQSATLVIRSMATDELEGATAMRLLGRELAVGLMLGMLVALVGLARVLSMSGPGTVKMSATITLTLICVVTLGALLGSGIPLLLRRLGIDPAVSSTPAIASIVDIAGLVVYFEIARLLFL